MALLLEALILLISVPGAILGRAMLSSGLELKVEFEFASSADSWVFLFAESAFRLKLTVFF